MFSLWSFGVLDLQLLGHAYCRGFPVRVVGKSLICVVENCTKGYNEAQDTKRRNPRELLVIPELTKREDGSCNWTIVERKQLICVVTGTEVLQRLGTDYFIRLNGQEFHEKNVVRGATQDDYEVHKVLVGSVTKNLSDNLTVAKILMHHADRNSLDQILVRFYQGYDHKNVGNNSVYNSILLCVHRKDEHGDRKHEIQIRKGDLPVAQQHRVSNESIIRWSFSHPAGGFDICVGSISRRLTPASCPRFSLPSFVSRSSLIERVYRFSHVVDFEPVYAHGRFFFWSTELSQFFYLGMKLHNFVVVFENVSLGCVLFHGFESSRDSFSTSGYRKSFLVITIDGARFLLIHIFLKRNNFNEMI